MAGHAVGDVRYVDGRDRHVDRRGRDAAPARRAQLDRRGDDLGDDRLRHRDRRGHAADRVPRPPLRPEARLSVLARAVRHRLGAVRPRALAADDGRLPRAAGIGGRSVATDRAGDPAPDLPARGAGHGDGALRPGGRRRPGDRPDAGRLHHRQLQLALDLLHQPAGRRARALHGHALRARAGGHPARQPRGGDAASAATSTGSASG